jgi:adenine-specific DNA-methyltransferase
MAQGFEENAEFFDLTYENPELVRHGMGFAAIAPLLWMRAGSEGRRIEAATDDYAIADTYGVLFDIDAAAGFVETMAVCERMRVAYVVTDDEAQYQAVARELPAMVETVRLYEAYLRTFQHAGGE